MGSPHHRLLEAAVTLLMVAICLHWAVILIAQVWPWLVGIGMVAAAVSIAWRVVRFRQERW